MTADVEGPLLSQNRKLYIPISVPKAPLLYLMPSSYSFFVVAKGRGPKGNKTVNWKPLTMMQPILNTTANTIARNVCIHEFGGRFDISSAWSPPLSGMTSLQVDEVVWRKRKR